MAKLARLASSNRIKFQELMVVFFMLYLIYLLVALSLQILVLNGKVFENTNLALQQDSRSLSYLIYVGRPLTIVEI